MRFLFIVFGVAGNKQFFFFGCAVTFEKQPHHRPMETIKNEQQRESDREFEREEKHSEHQQNGEKPKGALARKF
jgi:hypothetical protein